MVPEWLSAEGEPGARRISRADVALLRTAARNRWGVPDPIKTEAIFQLARILADPESDGKLRVAAARALAAFDRIDHADERLDLDRRRQAATADGDEPGEPIDPAAAERALKALNEPTPPGDPGDPAGDAGPSL